MIRLSKNAIDKIFNDELKEKEPNQYNILTKLYRIAFKNYDDIEKVESWPTVGKETSKYLFDKFIQFDKKIHPNIFSGGLWLNNGFSWDNKMGEWKINISECKIIYKEK